MKARTVNSNVGIEYLLSVEDKAIRLIAMSLVSNLLNLAEKKMSIKFTQSDAMDLCILIKNLIK